MDNKQKQLAPYGCWHSPITADLIAEATHSLSQVRIDQHTIYWLEQIPEQKGRSTILSYGVNGKQRDLISEEFNVRTRVHEYGGGDYLVHKGIIYFSNDSDQCLYRRNNDSTYTVLTPKPKQVMAWRYADMVMSSDESYLVCVRETHLSETEVQNELVMVPLDGSQNISVLQTGADFYSSPQISCDGSLLLFLNWNHPQMPWDGTELHLAKFNQGQLETSRKIAGGTTESVYQPRFGLDNEIYFVSDRTNWWNLYKYHRGVITEVLTLDAEVGYPAWVLGTNTYAIDAEGTIACLINDKNSWRLALLQQGKLQTVDLGCDEFSPTLAIDEHNIVCVAGSAAMAPAVIRVQRPEFNKEVLHSSSALLLDAAFYSLPATIEFSTQSDQVAYANFYAPQNPNYAARDEDRPPLIVFCHGGPTGSASRALNLKIQYWTSRGFAVVDVNYGGSTGYGREYRERLRDQWGIVDVADCVYAARYLVEQDLVDAKQLLIRGSSAGGFTTLCALTFYRDFAAGASYYGVADLESLAADTHKFEAHYLNTLVGPYPAARDIYRQRSPLYSASKITTPVIFLQGLQDKVVPPLQAETLIAELDKKQRPYAYITFEHEQHGFRDSNSISRALQAELAFYLQILRLKAVDELSSVVIQWWN